MKFVVEKKRWLRNRSKDKRLQGNSNSYSYEGGLLLNNSRMMCCLGHCVRQLGAKPKEIRGLGMPDELEVNLKTGRFDAFVIPGKTYLEPTPLSTKAANINDSGRLTDEEKIKKLKALFREYKHTIKFI